MSFSSVRGFYFFLLFGGLALVCFPFLENPLVFDDNYFFLEGAPQAYFNEGVRFYSRWWVYETLAATFVFLGADIIWLRAGNLFVHMAAVLALYFLIRRLLLVFDFKEAVGFGAEIAGFLSVVLFAVHPLSIFTQGYLIQRTILCATLFSILSLLSFLRGLGGSRVLLWLSCPLFGIGVFAKEHSVMIPFLSFLLFVLYLRSGLGLKFSGREIFCVFFIQLFLAVLVVFQSAGIIGSPYEIMTAEVLADEVSIPSADLYFLSFLNQAGLFFKYIFLWVFPGGAEVSIDMREVFPLDFDSWLLWVFAVLFILYLSIGFFFLFCGGEKGLLGFSLLVPGVLFFTELSVVRLQEPFVLYRSYLWAPGLFLILAMAFRRLSKRFTLFLVLLCALYFSALSVDRLTTLAHPYLVWDEAARLFENTSSSVMVYGGYRIYYNRGNSLYRAGQLDRAMADYDQVISIKPTYSYAYLQRGVIYSERKNWASAEVEFKKAILMLPSNLKSYLGLAHVLDAQGRTAEAREILKTACALGSQFACEK